jgi:hypothetical protein
MSLVSEQQYEHLEPTEDKKKLFYWAWTSNWMSPVSDIAVSHS